MIAAAATTPREPTGGRIRVVLDEWPLVVTWVDGRYTLADLEAMYVELDALFLRRERFAAITILHGERSLPTSAMRQRVVRWKRENDERVRLYNAAAAVVVDSVFARAAMRAIQWVAPHPAPYAICASVAEARAFCEAHLAASPTA